jgi:hypothetical protein
LSAGANAVLLVVSPGLGLEAPVWESAQASTAAKATKTAATTTLMIIASKGIAFFPFSFERFIAHAHEPRFDRDQNGRAMFRPAQSLQGGWFASAATGENFMPNSAAQADVRAMPATTPS